MMNVNEVVTGQADTLVNYGVFKLVVDPANYNKTVGFVERSAIKRLPDGSFVAMLWVREHCLRAADIALTSRTECSTPDGSVVAAGIEMPNLLLVNLCEPWDRRLLCDVQGYVVSDDPDECLAVDGDEHALPWPISASKLERGEGKMLSIRAARFGRYEDFSENDRMSPADRPQRIGNLFSRLMRRWWPALHLSSYAVRR